MSISGQFRIKIMTFTPDLSLKVLRRVLSRPKSIPMRPILSQVSSRSCFERNLKWRGCHAIWRRQVVDEFENVSQGTAIVLVVLKELSFDIGGFSLVPILPPKYGLQPCGLFMGPLKPKKVADIFKAIGVDRKVDVRMYDRKHICCSIENSIDFCVEGLR